MNKTRAKNRIAKLKKEINHHRYLYHVLDRQEISEAALDSLKHELFLLESKFPDLITQDSPTQRIGGKPLEKFEKIKHIVPQWSFNDAFSEKEIKDFDKRLKKELLVKNIEYLAELKIDGMHVILNYKNGLLKSGATRGDGKLGENVTQNLKTIESIPLKIKENIDVMVEGEVFMKKSVFEKINLKREKKGEPVFANPRNAAAGAIRQLDSRVVAERKLDCFFYDLSWPQKEIPETQEAELQKLSFLGFKVNKVFRLCRDIQEVISFWQEWQEKREKEDYWIDGIVVKVNKRTFQEKLGFTGKAPRWAIAFKWPGEQATTILKDVVFQVGRTGKITPVAVLQPVSIGGAVITRATLHNADEVQRLGVKIGDTVIVEKAGDVIPRVARVLKNLRSKNAKEIIFPKKCPVCDSKLLRPEGEVAHYCQSESCGAIRRKHLYYFVSKKAFNIEGLGPKIIDRLMDEGLISDAADLFLLKEGDLEPLERFAEKSAENIISAIQKSKKISLEKLFIACGIKYLGQEMAKLLLENFGKNIKNIGDLISFFEKTKKEDLEKIPGLGPKVALSIKKWFLKRENIIFLENLEKVGVFLEQKKLGAVSKKLLGKRFVFTGELDSMSREKAKERIEELGGKTGNSVSLRTNYLVIGKKPGAKLEKAKKLGVLVLKEKEFLKKIK